MLYEGMSLVINKYFSKFNCKVSKIFFEIISKSNTINRSLSIRQGNTGRVVRLIDKISNEDFIKIHVCERIELEIGDKTIAVGKIIKL